MQVKLGKNMDSTAAAFNSTPSDGTLKAYLKAVANYANFIVGRDNHGNAAGTEKHQECAKAIRHTKSQKHGALDGVDPDSIVRLGGGETAKFDVVWVGASDVYVYDFKFGEASSSSHQQDKYERALKGLYPDRNIHTLREIHPTNNARSGA